MKRGGEENGEAPLLVGGGHNRGMMMTLTPLLLSLKPTMNTFFILLAPLLCAATMVFVTPLERGSRSMLGVLVWVFTWWISEALPMPVTSMAPLFLFPLFGIASSHSVARSYMDDVIVLLLGTFIFAIAVDHYNIHRRIALKITLLFCGEPVRPRMLLFGLCTTTAFISMWVHNVAAAVLMMPVATGIVSRLPAKNIREAAVEYYSRAVILAVVYAVPIGGMSTLTGTGVNLILVGMWRSYFPNSPPITFNNWFLFAFPSALLLLLSLWLILSSLYCSTATAPALSPFLHRSLLAHELRLLGPLPFADKAVLSLFSVLIGLWMTRRITDRIPGWGVLFHNRVMDGTVSVMMATLLFIIPDGKRKGGKLMDWEKCKKLQWGIVLLLGAGLAIADGVRSSGLALVLSEKALGFLNGVPVWAMTPVICVVAATLTEFITSNNATALLLIPILMGTATALHAHPLLLMIPAALGSQFSFLLPTATPSNTVGFTTGHIDIYDMLKTGLLLKLAAVVVVSVTIPTLAPIVFPLGGKEVGSRVYY